jgi:hypothetical protein
MCQLPRFYPSPYALRPTPYALRPTLSPGKSAVAICTKMSCSDGRCERKWLIDPKLCNRANTWLAAGGSPAAH